MAVDIVLLTRVIKEEVVVIRKYGVPMNYAVAVGKRKRTSHQILQVPTVANLIVTVLVHQNHQSLISVTLMMMVMRQCMTMMIMIWIVIIKTMIMLVVWMMLWMIWKMKVKSGKGEFL